MLKDISEAEKDQKQRELIQMRHNKLKIMSVSKFNLDQIKLKDLKRKQWKQDQIQSMYHFSKFYINR